ncbi:P-loop containing nucleoside triphosphate hydrolase protein [Coniella lustricola]|uniref:ATP-dependent RNA helicase n=1 Tax=Coniella lustricola TaxID=2025994 RepID=A0A2T3A0N7_9PEZI|nr:P-loop containing nucleoside triphosphate hydrolase protein [Coniella lustricola]
MYARYIPPAKPSQAAAAPQPPPESSMAAAPLIASASATPYARYVPPTRKPQAAFTTTRKLDSPEPAPIPRVSSPGDHSSHTVNDAPKAKREEKDKKEKKDKKTKSHKSQDSNGDTKRADDDEDVDARQDSQHNKKKRKGEPFAFSFDSSSVAPDSETLDGNSSNVITSGGDKSTTVEAKKEKRHDTSTSSSGRRNNDDISNRHKAVLDKAAKSLKQASKHADAEDKPKAEDDEEAGAVEAQGLEPLPQPEPVPQEELKPAYETLPAWINNPLRVTPPARATFVDLGISNEIVAKLDAKGYKDAFAVQTAVIPLLMPSTDRRKDVVVSAATGSGKTLSYVLPMIRDVSQGTITRLRGIIVVPTRELVMQAKEVCELCAGAFAGPGRKTVKIGISMGNKQFEQEQADLVLEQQRFDPTGYQLWLQQNFSKTLDASIFDDVPTPLVDHVLDYTSKVDILICTPGRLVDHIKRTPGFSLDYVRWLVVDEADKLLAQTFQNWLPAVVPLLETTHRPGARDFPDSNKSGVQKVILSATMTRDLTLLNGLKLYRPKLVVLEGDADSAPPVQDSKTQHVLPESLQESAIKVRDPELKPLYLVDLLINTCSGSPDGTGDVHMTGVDDDDSDSSSATDSDTDSDTSSSSSDDDSDSESEVSDAGDESKQIPPSKSGLASVSKKAVFHSTALIFTKSNETAVRLSRLLSLLSPSLAPLIGTLTSTTRTSQRRKTLRAFASHKLRILVASDLVARGIDLADLDHVVNYDLPTSVASYVHRVGRTARANREGKAWTLFTKTEAGWFWTAIAGKGESKSQSAAGTGYIKRSTKVEEVKIPDRWDEDKVAHFESTLEKLGVEANEMRRKRR